MSSYTILITKRFEKDLEICKKRGLKLSLLYTVIEQLKLNGTLPKQYRAHKLSGNYANYWECHIKGDWLLIWEQNDDELILILKPAGSGRCVPVGGIRRQGQGQAEQRLHADRQRPLFSGRDRRRHDRNLRLDRS